MKKAKKESGALRFFYHTVPGRILLKPMVSRGFSRFCGAFLSSPLSKPLISGFVRKNGICLADYECDGFRSFNDCFSRKIKDGKRPIDRDPDALIAPCDGLLSVYRLTGDRVIPVKQSAYTLGRLLQDSELEKTFADGLCLVFRLCVNHYHRYVYAESGIKSENRFLPGVLHTVRPIALETYPVFTENCREYTVLQTERFGKILQMEVGAMLVGKIDNLQPGTGVVVRGEEKGRFLYGGSTIILLLERGAVSLPEAFFEETAEGKEIPVCMGMRLNVQDTSGDEKSKIQTI